MDCWISKEFFGKPECVLVSEIESLEKSKGHKVIVIDEEALTTLNYPELKAKIGNVSGMTCLADGTKLMGRTKQEIIVFFRKAEYEKNSDIISHELCHALVFLESGYTFVDLLDIVYEDNYKGRKDCVCEDYPALLSHPVVYTKQINAGITQENLRSRYLEYDFTQTTRNGCLDWINCSLSFLSLQQSQDLFNNTCPAEYQELMRYAGEMFGLLKTYSTQYKNWQSSVKLSRQLFTKLAEWHRACPSKDLDLSYQE